MKKGFSTIQKSLLVLLVFGTFVLGVLAFTTKAGTSIGVTLGLASTAGGLEQGLVGHWTFDGEDIPSGQVNDRSGNSNHGSQSNMATSTAYARGVIGQALRFDGVNDRIDLGNTLEHQLPITVSLWVKPDRYGGGAAAILFSNDKENTHSGVSVELLESGVMNLVYGTGAACAATARRTGVAPSSTYIATSTWTHVVAIFRGPTDMSVYLNGTDVGALSYSGSGGAIGYNAGDFGSIGQGIGTCASGTFQGLLDDVRMYTRGLSTDEVKHLYQLGATTRIGTTPSQPQTKTGLNTGLVGHWTLDGKDAPLGQVNDVSGQGNHGSQSQMSTSSAYARGALGQALNFDGADDSVSLSVTSATDLDSNYTLSAWVNPRFLTSGASKATIIKRGASNNLDPGSQYQIRINQSQASFTLAFVTSDGTSAQTDTFGAVPANKWSLVTCTHDGTTKTCYIDGVVSGSPAADTVGNYTGTEAVEAIGCASVSCGAGQFAGAIDDVRIYNRVLLLDEIKQLYQLGATTKIAATPSQPPTKAGLNRGLIGHWTFDGKDMPVGQVNDVSGSGFHGSQINMSTTSAYVRGAVGQAIQCDGANDTIRLGTTMNIPGDIFSFSAWIKMNAFTGTDQVMFVSGGTPDTYWGLMVTGSTNALRLFDDGAGANVTEQTAFTAGQWYHVVAVKTDDGGTNNGILYINGVQEQIGGTTYGFSTTGGVGRICSRSEAVDLFFNGQIDDVRVYNRALSFDEVKQLYQTGR